MTRILPALALVSFAACNHARFDEPERDTRTYRESIDRGDAKELSAEFHMGAGELRISGGAGAKLLEADIRTSGNRPKFRYDAGSRGRLMVEQHDQNFRGSSHNDWDIRLSEELPLDVEVHLGAGQARLDLGELRLRKLNIHMGAGQLILDLRGKFDSDVEVEIHGGVGEARLRLPKKMRIEAEVHGGLGSVSAHGLDHEDDRYVSRGPGSGPKMKLEIHGGIGSIDLDAN